MRAVARIPPSRRRSGGSVSRRPTVAATNERGADRGEHEEDAAPARDLEHLAADHRREDRGEAGDEHQHREEAHERDAVSGCRARSRGRSRCPAAPVDPLHEAQPGERPHGRGGRAQQPRRACRRRRRPAAAGGGPKLVAQRPGHELADREAGEAGGQRELAPPTRRGARSPPSAGRPGRYMSIDSGRERRQPAQQQGQAGARCRAGPAPAPTPSSGHEEHRDAPRVRGQAPSRRRPRRPRRRAARARRPRRRPRGARWSSRAGRPRPAGAGGTPAPRQVLKPRWWW